MTGEELFEILLDIDDEYITSADAPKRVNVWMKWSALAACLCLVTAFAVFIRVFFVYPKGTRQGLPLNTTNEPEIGSGEVTYVCGEGEVTAQPETTALPCTSTEPKATTPAGTAPEPVMTPTVTQPEPAVTTNVSDEYQSQPIVGSDGQHEHVSFGELVTRSDIGLLGRYVEYVAHENYVEYGFEVVDLFYGQVEDRVVYLNSNYGYGFPPENVFEEGKQYVLILERSQYIMYDHDRYLLAADLLLCPEDGVYTMYSEPLAIPENTTLKDYILSLCTSEQLAAHVETQKPAYQSALEEAFGEAAFVGRVRIDSIMNEDTNHNGTVYYATVSELYKGRNLNSRGGTIMLVIFKNTVEVGGEYIVGFTPPSEYSLIYSQSTDSSVFEITDELLAEISAYVE